MTPHRRAISSFRALRFAGSGCLAICGTLIHGSPRRLVIFTPPVVPSRSASFSLHSAATCCSFRLVINAAGSRGLLSAW